MLKVVNAVVATSFCMWTGRAQFHPVAEVFGVDLSDLHIGSGHLKGRSTSVPRLVSAGPTVSGGRSPVSLSTVCCTSCVSCLQTTPSERQHSCLET